MNREVTAGNLPPRRVGRASGHGKPAKVSQLDLFAEEPQAVAPGATAPRGQAKETYSTGPRPVITVAAVCSCIAVPFAGPAEEEGAESG